MRYILPFLFITACSGGSPGLPPDQETTGVRPDGDICLLDKEVCTGNGDCCSNSCVQMDGWWRPRCVSTTTLHNQRFPELGYNERHCQWDSCNPPPSEPLIEEDSKLLEGVK